MDKQQHTPLDSLELYELIVAAYPEKFDEEKDGDIWTDVHDFVEELGCEGGEAIADLLGRVVMLTMPLASPLSGAYRHALGKVSVSDGRANMMAAVTREFEPA